MNFGVDPFGEEIVLRKAPEAMLWPGQLPTGADGKTPVKVAAPREPAQWRVTARAVSGGDRFGLGTRTINIR